MIFLLVFVLLSNSAYGALTDNLIAYWKLDETSAGAVVDIYAGNNGTNYGATINQVGKIGRAYDFDGNAYISITGITGGTTQTFALWIYADSTVAGKAIFDVQTGRMQFVLNEENSMALYDGTAWRKFGATISTAGWHYLVLTLNGATSKANLYVDNVQSGSEQSYTPRNIGGAVKIGSSYPGAGNFIDAKIDEFGIWSKVLNSTEVTELYNNGTGLSYPFGPVDTCTAPASGNWAVDCSDNCDWTTPQNVPGNVTMTGSGHLTLSDIFTFTGLKQYIIIGAGCLWETITGGSIQ